MRTKINEKKAKKEIQEKLKAVFMDGLSQGTKAICGVVLEEIGTADKSAEDKIETLRIFCEKSLGLSMETER